MKDNQFLSGFAAIVGRPNVGKSTMMNAMVGEKVAIVSSRPQTTRNRIMGVATAPDHQIVFLDTPGLHKPRTKLGEYMVKSVEGAMDGIDVLLVLVDVSDVGPQDRAIVEEMAARQVKKILVLNKTDIVDEAKLMATIQSFSAEKYDAIVPISARTGKTMEEAEAEFAGQGYGVFKPAVADAVVELLRPIREESERLMADKVYLESVYREGAQRAQYLANKTLAKVQRKVGFAAR